MFSPITPILPAATVDDTTGEVLARVDAIGVVLAALARMAGAAAATGHNGLSRDAELCAALAVMDKQRVARMMVELDGIAAALQAGFVALEKARVRGHQAAAATRLLHAEATDAFAATLAAAATHSADI
ncbi:hypothetical protein [Blastomonas sp. AAP53]|uniref:hypothetical protein n=1 Tax=Blastomonas sp. AAP53 TaxID=1248760 RepID=UPI0002FD6F0D|nr:hypothetical protein [Blastomonas sp. AAP53]